MIYTDMTNKAMKICFEAHKDQVDKGGIPYVFHPYHIAEKMHDEDSVCVALLHDVVEDTDVTFEDLEKEGFNENVIGALKLLTHPEGVPYLEYIERIKGNELAVKVKRADMRHNMDETRVAEGVFTKEQRAYFKKKYRDGWKVLNRK